MAILAYYAYSKLLYQRPPLVTPKTGILANNEYQDEMQHNAAFYQGLHYLLRFKQPSGIEIHNHLEISIYDPFKYTMGSPILFVSLCMGKS